MEAFREFVRGTLYRGDSFIKHLPQELIIKITNKYIYSHVNIEDAIKSGWLYAVKKLMRSDKRNTQKALMYAAEYDQFKILKWLHKRYPNLPTRDVIKGATMNNNKEMVIWCYKELGEIQSPLYTIHSDEIFDIVNTHSTDIDRVQAYAIWIKNDNMHMLNKFECNIHWIRAAAVYGKFDLIKDWFVTNPELFNLFNETMVVVHAAIKGYIDILEWLHIHSNYNFNVLPLVCKRGRSIEAAELIYRYVPNSDLNMAMTLAAGNQLMIDWLSELNN